MNDTGLSHSSHCSFDQSSWSSGNGFTISYYLSGGTGSRAARRVPIDGRSATPDHDGLEVPFL